MGNKGVLIGWIENKSYTTNFVKERKVFQLVGQEIKATILVPHLHVGVLLFELELAWLMLRCIVGV